MSSRRIGIGLLGFGTVGSGLYAHLQEKGEAIEKKCGVHFDVRKVLVRDPLKKRSVAIPADRLATSFQEIIADDTIDVIVEVIGGNKEARAYILEALKNGKHVITANKSLVAMEESPCWKSAAIWSLFWIFGCRDRLPSALYFYCRIGSH